MYGTCGKWETSESSHADSVRSHPHHKKTRVQPTTIYRHALLMVSLTHQFHRVEWSVGIGNRDGPLLDCFACSHYTPCSHGLVPRYRLQNICTGPMASRKHLNQFIQTMYAAIPTPTRRHSTSHNNTSPCTIDGAIYSPVAIKSFLLTAGGNALQLRSTHRAVSALGSAFTRVGATILSATYMYGTDGK